MLTIHECGDQSPPLNQGRNSWGVCVWGGGDTPTTMFANAILSGNLFKARAICWARLPCFTVGKQRKNRIAEFED